MFHAAQTLVSTLSCLCSSCSWSSSLPALVDHRRGWHQNHQYVRNSNWRHRSKTHSNVIVFDLEKWDVPASVIKGRRVFLSRVSDYASEGDACSWGRIYFYDESGRVSHSVFHHESMRVSFYHESSCATHSVYRGWALEWSVSISFPPYKVHS
jgi:hypothetical protein